LYRARGKIEIGAEIRPHGRGQLRADALGASLTSFLAIVTSRFPVL
jgi:hypothetical protein